MEVAEEVVTVDWTVEAVGMATAFTGQSVGDSAGGVTGIGVGMVCLSLDSTFPAGEAEGSGRNQTHRDCQSNGNRNCNFNPRHSLASLLAHPETDDTPEGPDTGNQNRKEIRMAKYECRNHSTPSICMRIWASSMYERKASYAS